MSAPRWGTWFFNLIKMAQKNRRWTFTLNNYTDIDLSNLDLIAPFCKYLLVGYEIGEKGTPHLQGYIEFENPRRFSGVKNLISDRAHIEIAHSSGPTNQKYCKKQKKTQTVKNLRLSRYYYE